MIQEERANNSRFLRGSPARQKIGSSVFLCVGCLFGWRQTVTGGVWILGSIKAHPSVRGGKTVSLVRVQNPSLNASVTCHRVTHCTVIVGLLAFTSKFCLLKHCPASSYQQSPLPSLFPIYSVMKGFGGAGQEEPARVDQKSHYLADFRMPAFHLFSVSLKQVLELQKKTLGSDEL